MEISDLSRDIFVHWIVVNPNDSLISLLILIVCMLVIIKNSHPLIYLVRYTYKHMNTRTLLHAKNSA